MRRYLWLALVNLFISTFTFGGGYVVVPMVRKYFIEKKHIFTEAELMDMAAIAQSTPGAIAVNLVTLAGYRTAGMAGLIISGVCAVIPPIVILGVPGAVAATLGCVVSGVGISLFLYRFFKKHRNSGYILEMLNGLKASSLGLIVSAAVSLLLLAFTGAGTWSSESRLDLFAAVVFTAALLAIRKWKMNPVLMLLLTGTAGGAFYFIS